MDRETLEKGLALKKKIDQCAALHDAFCDALGGAAAHISVFSEKENRMKGYLIPEELIPEILSDIEGCLSDLQKSFREL